MTDADLLVRRAIDRYNRFRAPMARATLVGQNTGGYRIRFTGPFRRTCCPDEYLEDLRYEMDELGLDQSTTAWTDIQAGTPETIEATLRVAAGP